MARECRGEGGERGYAMIYSLEEIGLFRDRRTARAHRAIGEAFQVVKNAPLKISGEVIAGEATPQIIDRAKNWGADLIVVGTHERRGLKRLLFGGTSAAVASRAHCSVKVIRGRSGSRTGKSLRRRSIPSVRNVGKVYRLEENLGRRAA